MKRFLIGLITSIMMICLVGCDSDEKTIAVNVEGIDNTQLLQIGTLALIEIGNDLWYDQSTRVVYFWNGHMIGYRSDTTPSPYYASNGLPYLFNPETSTFEMIEQQ